MTKEELLNRAEWWQSELIENEFPISDNISSFKIGWSTKNGGVCSYKHREDSYSIILSKHILKFDIKDIDEIIVHELLHTIYGCLNHKHKWQYWANKASKTFSLNITQYMRKGLHLIDREEAKKARKPYKYYIKCDSCGVVFGYKILSKPYKSILKNQKVFYCAKCGSYELKPASREEYVEYMRKHPI